MKDERSCKLPIENACHHAVTELQATRKLKREALAEAIFSTSSHSRSSHASVAAGADIWRTSRFRILGTLHSRLTLQNQFC